MNSQVTDFWRWFSENSTRLAGLLEEDNGLAVAQLMKPQMESRFPTIGWEIGPSIGKSNYLAFVLFRDPENIDLVRDLVTNAPEISNWKFLPGAQRKDEAKEVVFQNRHGQTIKIDTSEWLYTLDFYEEDRLCDLQLHCNKALRIDETGIRQAIETIVVAALGELVAMKAIEEISYVPNPDQDWRSRSTPLEFLYDHVMSIVDRSSSKA